MTATEFADLYGQEKIIAFLKLNNLNKIFSIYFFTFKAGRVYILVISNKLER